MSGGSFDYLCWKNGAQALADVDNLRRMAWELATFGPSQAYADTDALLALALELDERTDRLRAVWKAVEWCVSSDWGPDDVLQAINAYEAAGDTKGQQP